MPFLFFSGFIKTFLVKIIFALYVICKHNRFILLFEA